MPLADCIQKVGLSKEEADALMAAAAKGGSTPESEKAAVEAAGKDLANDTEDVRKQLGAPGPEDLETPAVPEDEPSQSADTADAAMADHIRELYQIQPTRVPTSKKAAPYDPTNIVTIGWNTLVAAPKAFAKIMAEVITYPNYVPVKGKAANTPEMQAERFIKHVVDNLLWLHDLMPPNLRDRARLWYDGGRRIIDRWVKEYGYTDMQVAGVIAVFSPQTDWYANVARAQRVLDFMTSKTSSAWTPEMGKTADEILKNAEERAVVGRAFAELTTTFEKAVWIRVYDESHNDRSYPVITPEGDFIAARRTAKGETSTLAWANYGQIEKALEILADGSAKNVSEQLGGEHKVRNFYNNLFEPNATDGHVTIDTHAVAAALFSPLSGGSDAVLANLGGVGSDAATGLSGTYALYAEAYRRAAKARGLLPREIQSITWEAVRGIFTPAWKRGQQGSGKEAIKNTEAVEDIWKRHRKGEITQAQARDEILALAGGLRTPDWGGAVGSVKATEGTITWGEIDADLKTALTKPGWAIVTATQEARGAATDPSNVEANDALSADLRAAGISFRVIDGVYDGVDQGRSFMILADAKTALELGRRFSQESVLTSDGYLFSDGSIVPSKGVFLGAAARKQKGYSTFRGEEKQAFSLDLDWDNKRGPEVKQLNQPKASKTPRTVAEAIAAGKPFRAIHWSTAEGISKIDPAFAGASGGKEVEGYKTKGVLKRVFFGLLGRYRKESNVLGTNPYESTIDPAKVYDIYADPHGFREEGKKKFPKEKDWRKAQQHADNLARAAGFEWFHSSKEGPWFPVLYSYGAVNVKAIAASEAVDLVHPTQATPTDAERQVYNYGQNGIRIAGRAELGNTFESRRRFYQEARRDVAMTDGALSLAAKDVPELKGAAFPTTVWRMSRDGGEAEDILTAGGDGEPYYLKTEQKDILDLNGDEKVDEEGAAALAEYRIAEGTPVRDAFKKLSRKLGPAQAAKKLNEALGGFISTAIFEDEDGVLHATTNSVDQLIDPETKVSPRLQQDRRGSVTITDEKYIIRLYEGSDMSTALHELGHVFLEELHQLAKSGAATHSTMMDYEAAMAWLGNTGEPITREQHEKWATHFEVYLMEGKAPSEALRGSFSSFRQWMTTIYSKVVSTGTPTGTMAMAGIMETSGIPLDINPEIRGVFDRLLSLGTEARAQEIVGEFGNLPPIEPDNDLAKAKRVTQRELLDDARRELEDRLHARRSAIIASKKKGWEAEAKKQLEASRLYKLAADLAKFPLDAGQIAQGFGDKVLRQLQTLGFVANPREAGADLDVTAINYGFASAGEMITALRSYVPIDQAVREAVKGASDQAWEAYTAADAMADTPGYAKALKASGDYIAQVMGKAPNDSARIEAEAEARISAMTVRQAVRVDDFLGSMARLQRAESAAALKGDLAAALEANRKARVQMAMAKRARKIKEQVLKIGERAARLKKIEPGTVAYQYHANALALAVRYELIKAPEPKDRIPLRALITAAQDPTSDLYEPSMDVLAAFPDWVLDEKDGTSYLDLTIDDLKHVDNMSRFLEQRGRKIVKDEILNGKATLEKAVAEIIVNVAKRGDKKVFTEGTIAARVMGMVDAYLAGLNTWLFRVRAMDGFTSGTDKAGPAERLMWEPLHEGSGKVREMHSKVHKMIEPALKHLRARMTSMPRFIETGVAVPDSMKRIGRPGFSFENIVVAALNMGNDYNKTALMEGLGLQSEDDLQKLTAVLTEADWLAVQAIWKAVNTLKDPLAEVFERRMGFPMTTVGANPLTVRTAEGKTITLEGGYYPVKFDTKLSDRAAERSEADDLKNAAGSLFPVVGTKSGMTKTRRGTGGQPLMLSMSGLEGHLKDTTQYIGLSEAVVDIYRIARHPSFRRIFEQKFGREAYLSIRKLLADIGMPEAGGQEKMDQVLGWLRGAATAWTLGLNFGTAIKQTNAVFNFAADEGFGTAAIGAKAVAQLGYSQAVAQMQKLSPFMADRWVASDREISDAIKGVSWASSPKLAAVQQAMFLPIQVMDRATVLPLWWGAFTKRIQSGMTEEEAKVGADKAIAATVPGAPRALDQPAFLRDKRGWMRLLTSFSTFTFHWGNRQRFYYEGLRAGAISPTQFGYKVVVEGIAAPVGTLMMMAFLWGTFPPEEAEREETYKQWGLDLATYQLAGLPIVREMANLVGRGAVTGRLPESFGGAIPTFGGIDLAVKAGYSLQQLVADMGEGGMNDEKPLKALKALADMISFGARIPASKVLEKLYEGWRQLEAFPNDDAALEWLNDGFTLLVPNPARRGK